MASSKGSSYERALCGKLSLWWSRGARDDIFWRSPGSGARAKVRGRRGRSTDGQHGDILATDAEGEDLIKVFTLELKRGYSGSSPFDVFDKADKAAEQTWESFYAQASESALLADSLYWAIISKRDRRSDFICLPLRFIEHLIDIGYPWDGVKPYVEMTTESLGEVALLRLDSFLDEIPPHWIRRVARDAESRNR
jgi:hypothetical protein